MSKAYSYYKLNITDFRRQNSTQTFANLSEFKIYDNEGNNIAMNEGAIYSAISTDPSEGSLESAFDNNFYTYWHSDWRNAPNTVNWLQVQLAEPVVATSIGLVALSIGYGNDFINSFSFYASNDGNTWDLLFEQSDLYSGWTPYEERKFYIPVIEDETKYLIRDGAKLYTVVDGALSNITGEMTIDANLFTEFGIDAIPDSSLLMSLSYPEILCWTDEEELPTLKATVNGIPVGTHEIISDEISLVHPSIYGIIGVTVNASENAMFLMSFDGGSWKIYNSISNTWNDSGIGMTGEELSAISSEVWEDVFNSCQYMRIKAIISGSESVTRVKVNFLNESGV